MSYSSMKGTGGWRITGSRAKLIAVIAVLLMVFSSAVCIAGAAEDGSAEVQSTKDPNTAYETTVVYMPGSLTLKNTTTKTYNVATVPADRSVTYYGNVISTEYNPQVWDQKDKDGNAIKWYEIKEYSVGNTAVFTGWKYSADEGKNWTTNTYDPGDVLRCEGGYWYIGNTAADSEHKNAFCAKDKTIYIQAQWGTLKNYASGGDLSNISWSDGDKYTNIFVLSNNVQETEPDSNTYTNEVSVPSTVSTEMTIRGGDSTTATLTFSSSSVTNLKAELTSDEATFSIRSVRIAYPT